MARSWVAASEPIIAFGHPMLPDSKNRVGKEIWESFLEEHNNDGTHKNPYDIFLQPIIDTYSGNGTTQTITPLLDGIASDIKAVGIWSASYGGLYIRTDTMTKTVSSALETGFTNGIITIDSTNFIIGSDARINSNGITYYYIVLMASSTPDAGSNSSPPTWITHGTPLLGGGTGTSANSVEYAIDNGIFQVEHSEGGIHTEIAFAELATVETGIFQPDGTSDQHIELENQSLTPNLLFFAHEGYDYLYFLLSSMNNLRSTAADELDNTGLVSMTTGEIILDSTIVGNEIDQLIILSDTTNGSTIITDSSGYYGNALDFRTGVAHSTDTSHSGATSLKFQVQNSFAFKNNNGSDYWWYSEGSWSLSFWINSNITGPDDNGLLDFTYHYKEHFDDNSILATIFQVCMTSSGTLRLEISPTGSIGTITTTTNINDGSWHQVELIWENKTWSIQIDGTPEGGTFPHVIDFWYLVRLRIGYAGNYGSLIPTAGTFYLDDLYMTCTHRLLRPGVSYHYLCME